MQNAQNPFKQRTLGISVEGETIFLKPYSVRMHEHYFVSTEDEGEEKFKNLLFFAWFPLLVEEVFDNS